MPPATPVTVPEDEPTVAVPVLLLLQVPPDVELVRVDVAPAQNTSVPPIAAGLGFTVAIVEVEQPVDKI